MRVFFRCRSAPRTRCGRARLLLLAAWPARLARFAPFFGFFCFLGFFLCSVCGGEYELTALGAGLRERRRERRRGEHSRGEATVTADVSFFMRLSPLTMQWMRRPSCHDGVIAATSLRKAKIPAATYSVLFRPLSSSPRRRLSYALQRSGASARSASAVESAMRCA